MRFEGTERIHASRRAVWEFLSDPPTVCHCIPGLERVRPVEPGREVQLTLNLDLGFLHPTIDFQVVLTSRRPDREARMWLRGKGADSHIGGSGYVILTDLGDGSTELHWAFFFSAAGWIAGFGDWLPSHAVRKMSLDFFAAVHQHLADVGVEPEPMLVRAS